MKTLRMLACMAVLLATASCKDDDAATAAPNQVLYDGNSYGVPKGYVVDSGASTVQDADGSTRFVHYNHDFYLTDGTYTLDGEVVATNAGQLLYLELFSPGEEGAKTGTFHYVYDVHAAAESSFAFEELSFTVDSNGDKIIDWELDETFYANAGVVTVNSSGTNYEILVDVTLENGKKLKATYNGSLEHMVR